MVLLFRVPATEQDRCRTRFLNLKNEGYLSAASAWEIGIKHATGRFPPS
jgi:PIN domain nuclease of toxin-antitoxin system